MPRFKLTIEYAGTRYSGWQIQKNARTVAGELERTIANVTGVRSFELYGAGRTDAGVHALAQVAHLQIDTRIDASALAWRVNDELPADINILDLERAPQRFHARHDAVARSYLYQVARRRTAVAKPYVWWVREDLHVKAMRDAAAAFVGLQDFRGFSANDPEETSSKVQVDRVEIIEEPPLLLIRVVGSHFLWRMVRRMVGVLVAVGRRELKPADVPRMLVEASSESAALAAPASGLFLERVYYPGDDREGDTCRPRGQSGTRSGPSGCGVRPFANS
ncbi:MAG TPA: tRNA pseudouridine(38-40) synthase TruA [Vicinamibacterales bacterium]|nr:tRNA pseudouridine(38-40) synthase TruA [Vicinamibacterales bacterium]